jgi:hypothetical protein
MTDLLKIAGDALSRIAHGNLLNIAMTISRHPLTAGRFGKYLVNAAFAGVIDSGCPVVASRPEAIRHAVWLYLRFTARVDPNLGFSGLPPPPRSVKRTFRALAGFPPTALA